MKIRPSVRVLAVVPGLFLLASCSEVETEPPAELLASSLLASGAAEAAVPAPPPPEIVAPRDRAPDIIRGLYLNAYAAGSKRRLPQLLEMAAQTEINTFVVDVKTENGIHFAADLPLAQELALDGHVTVRDLAALADTLHAHGLHAIARIVVFKDPLLAKARPEWSIRKPNGELWVDKAGNHWVSAWDRNVWNYNLEIAEAAARAGFDEIQFDYVRFPEQYRSLPEQVHPQADGERTEAIAAFLQEARERIHPLGAIVAADLFGLSMNEASDVGIGQQWEALSSIADHLLPMVYPSHYFPTHLRGVKRPNRMPYETVFASVGMGVVRNQRLAEAGARPARIVSWLQAFDAPWVDKHFPYGPEQARAQIEAIHDLGLEDWIFWHPGSKYEPIADAFHATTEPRARPFTPSADLLAVIERFEAEGVRQARADTVEP